MLYVKVIVEISVKAVDKMFIYSVPIDLVDKIKVGARVKVSFGYQVLEGFVLEMMEEIDVDYEIKSILELVDEEPILNQEMLLLGREISEKILCSRISIYQAMLPKALKASYKTDIKIKMVRYLILNWDRKEVLSYLESCRFEGQVVWLKKLLEMQEMKVERLDSSVKTLVKKGICRLENREDYRFSYQTNEEKKDKKVDLNFEQIKVVDRVMDSLGENRTFLLYGVTGAGKTEVYMHIIDGVLRKGKNAIVLVPEISLTPQIVERFVLRFGEDVAILHSGLSDGEKYDEYRKIRDGKVHIVVGARSAVFAPLSSLGVIIIDEEHSSTYKQDNHPRYHARDVAILRGKYHQCPVLLGSATPSMESMARAMNHVYELLTLTKRAGMGAMPKVMLVDMKEDVKKGNFIFSSLLDQKIRDRLAKNEQVILLLNRRGYTSIESCNACGEAMKCPNCDISLTYHKTSGMLRCHYCGYAVKKYVKCPKCGANDLKDYGLGTQKLEEELRERYLARVVRMDVDTTSKKGAHQKIIDAFGEHQYDILVGTQMIAKGLDFPKVTLVGVIQADASLNVPDFRSSERTFQLLCQVSGRAGRAEYPGEVVIQTYNNQHYSIMLAKYHDYLGFYKEEMKIRKQLNYSPYYYIILIRIMTKDYELSFQEAKKVGDYLKKNLSSTTIVLGPAMASVFRVDNVYYQQCIIKYKKDDKLKKVLLSLDQYYKGNVKVRLEIDMEPNRL